MCYEPPYAGLWRVTHPLHPQNTLTPERVPKDRSRGPCWGVTAQRELGMAKNPQHGSREHPPGTPVGDAARQPPAAPYRTSVCTPETSGKTSSPAVGEKPAQTPGARTPTCLETGTRRA